MTTAMSFSAWWQDTRTLGSSSSDTSVHKNLQPSLQPEEDIPVLLEDSIMCSHETVSYLVEQNNSSFVTPCIGLIGFQSIMLDPVCFRTITKLKLQERIINQKHYKTLLNCINTNVENSCINVFL